MTWHALRWLVIPLLGLLCLPALAQLRLVDVWQSGMVVQRDQPIMVWGWGKPGTVVRVTLGKEQQRTRVNSDSTWTVRLAARKASVTADSLTIDSNDGRITLTNLLMGDVWVCAGQSNMAFPLVNDQFARQTLAAANNPRLRLYNQPPALTTYNPPYQPADIRHLSPNQFYKPTRWQPADSASARLFSAVGYYAGRLIQADLAIPIGLIHVAVGGSPTEAWMHPDALTTDSAVQAIWTGDWWTNPVLETWCIQRGHENLDGLLKAGQPVPRDSLGYNHPFKPGFLYEAAIRPLLRLGIKGILWYQGESNALSLERVRQHEQLFPQLVASWRTDWQQPNLPVYICQLSSIGTEKGYHSENWPLFRDSQRRMAEQIPHVGMVVTSDVGHLTDVHPTNKKAVGERLAIEMLAKTYARPGAARPNAARTYLPGPTVRRITRTRSGWQITIANAGRSGLKTGDNQPVRGFAISDEAGPRADLSVTLRRDKITVATPVTKSATYLYYGWQPFTTANVVNSNGLPLSTFRLPLP